MMPFAHLRHNPCRIATTCCVAASLWLFLACAHAQSGVRHADVERELKQERFQQVLVLSQKALADRPRDPQMRFWYALALDKTGQMQAAFHQYQALTQDHPELPEPHNNLGVLLLRMGRMDEAQAAFQMALRMDSGYAEAMENMGDVLQWQARRWYEKSLQSGWARPALKQKINALPPLPQPQ